MRVDQATFVAFLRRQGHRVTRERQALCEEVFRQHGHLDAEALLRALRARRIKISRATVYRNLELLVACGLVRKHRLGRDRYLFEHQHAGQDHDHLVCRECGRVIEFVSPAIAALQTEICRAHGFSPAHHSLQITGLCRSCERAEVAPAAGEARHV